jgi:hypothetical protein
MSTPDDGQLTSRLGRALTHLAHVQRDWLGDLDSCCRQSAPHLPAFRRWEEQLTLLKLHLHRTEAQLLRSSATALPASLPAPVPRPDHRAIAHRWRGLIEGFFAAHRLDGAYRRLDSVLDHDQEAVTADIVTDLVLLAEVVETTGTALSELESRKEQTGLEELSFYRVVGPWRAHGLAALADVLRWLAETLREEEDW